MQIFTSLIFLDAIRFPNLGWSIDVPRGFSVFGFEIAFYGICIAIGMICGYLIAAHIASVTNQSTEYYLDFAIYAIIISVICARLYYVAFEFDQFKGDLLSIINLRTGGLAIYGGVIGAVGSAIVYARIKKYPFFLMVDTGIYGLVLGQIIGRFGNFFNREVFGGYTDNPLAMQLSIYDVSSDFSVDPAVLATRYPKQPAIIEAIMNVRDHITNIGGIDYIQVHPTFLYEIIWNICLLAFMLIFRKHKKFEGEIFFIYLGGYGLGRFFIEGIRTDQLFLWGTAIPVSQGLSALLFVVAAAAIVIGSVRAGKKKVDSEF